MMVWFVAAAVVVFILAGIALYLHWQLYNQKRKVDSLLAEQQKVLLTQRMSSLDSIMVLANALLEGQVTLTEASIRISVLMEALVLPSNEKQNYISFYKLAEATAHIPILEGWKALSRQDKKRFDKEREQQEKIFHDFLVSAAKRLIVSREAYQRHIAQLEKNNS